MYCFMYPHMRQRFKEVGIEWINLPIDMRINMKEADGKAGYKLRQNNRDLVIIDLGAGKRVSVPLIDCYDLDDPNEIERDYMITAWSQPDRHDLKVRYASTWCEAFDVWEQLDDEYMYTQIYYGYTDHYERLRV